MTLEFNLGDVGIRQQLRWFGQVEERLFERVQEAAIRLVGHAHGVTAVGGGEQTLSRQLDASHVLQHANKYLARMSIVLVLQRWELGFHVRIQVWRDVEVFVVVEHGENLRIKRLTLTNRWVESNDSMRLVRMRFGQQVHAHD